MKKIKTPTFGGKKRIAVQYVMWMFPILILSTLLIGMLIYSIEKKELISHNEDVARNLTKQVSGMLESWLKDQLKILMLISAEPVVEEACANLDNAIILTGAKGYLQTMVARYPQYEKIQVAVLLPQDRMIHYPGRSVMLKNGDYLINTQETGGDMENELDRPHIQEVFQGKPFFIGDVQLGSRENNNHVFPVSAPVIKDGQILGAVVISIKMNYVTDLFVGRFRMGETGFLFVFDDRGFFISHPKDDLFIHRPLLEAIHKHLGKSAKKESSFLMNENGVDKRFIIHKLNQNQIYTNLVNMSLQGSRGQGSLKGKNRDPAEKKPENMMSHAWYTGFIQHEKEVTDIARNFLMLLIISGGGFFLILCVFLFWITNRIFILPIREAAEAAGRLAAYDLTIDVAVKREDEIGVMQKAQAHMIERFRDVLTMLSETTESINSQAMEIADSANQQASVATQQNASVSQITSTMSELSASYSQIADHAQSVAKTAESALENSKAGQEAVGQVMAMMQEISEDNQRNMTGIIELGNKSKEIDKVMKIINNITDQTKLIAFNAALEATSAGETGKRFGVVASEIRRLADNVMDSTQEIEEKIVDIQNAVEKMIVSSEKSTKSVARGMEHSRRTVETLDTIVTGGQSTVDAAKQISLSTQQQKTASEQIVIALREIDKGQGQTLTAIKNISDISSKMESLADRLHELMNRFILKKSDSDDEGEKTQKKGPADTQDA